MSARDTRPLIDRVYAHVTIDSVTGCHTWVGPLSHGYGVLAINRRKHYTHRITYALRHGPIPDALTIDHLCRNRACCNPDHLEAVTNRENIMRGESVPAKNGRKTHCPRGHELVGDNLRRRGGRSANHRECLTCHRDYMRTYRRPSKRPA